MQIQAKTIAEAWWLNLRYLCCNAYHVDIQRGSYEKVETRHQLEWLNGVVEFPLQDMVPAVPQGMPQPTTREYIESYFYEKIINDKLASNEDYNYGQRIMSQLPDIIEMLRETPFTNQAVIEVGLPEDRNLTDPPCLRTLTFKVIPGNPLRLNLGVYFRSWELYAGFPTNLGSMAMLQQFVAGFLQDKDVQSGRIYYSSDGAHIYSYNYNYVKEIVK